MVHPQTAISTERHNAILETAIALFGSKGYQSVTIDEIAKTAGVSRGLIHYHFGNKEDLLLQIVSSGRSIITESLYAISQRDDTARHKITEALTVYMQLATSRLAVAQMMLIAFFEVPHTQRIRNDLLDAYEEIRLQFRGLIEEGLANGEVRSMDGAVATRLAIGMALETIKAATLEEAIISPYQAAEDITGVLFDGIGS